ncbi:E3 ubiquitin-protein ligase RNF183 [Bombina bombina]|uniref:E3 ubiquitin-protein ligase RNF183 n=1 Tax=Bombina bombina TaxID=8345 RepID=UPI00235AC3B9|nr:E3 ubiquitin-protein ligase RNF183 [Bombina bombina]
MAEGTKLDPECDCPVCWNPYNNSFRIPKLLDCHHFFCLECLTRLSLVTQLRNRLQCPLCRRTTIIPINQVVSDLPTNTALLSNLKPENHQEAPHLCSKDIRKLHFFQRPPSVYTLNVGVESGALFSSNYNQLQTPIPTIPDEDSLHQCVRNPQFRMFTYLMLTMLIVSLLLIFSVFWTRKYLWGPG